MLYEIGLLCTIGLGLWVLVDVASALPRRHGGTLEAANRSGGGAVFTLLLAPAPGAEVESEEVDALEISAGP
jgi:K+-sensing histidine kinase KdpD